jgi:hypothetical protein
MFTPLSRPSRTIDVEPVLLDTTTHLPDGARVRLRLPQAGDRQGLLQLYGRLGVHATPLDLERALRFDPRRRAVVCATAWVGVTETIVGYAAIDLDAQTLDVLMVDEDLAPGLRVVLESVLTARGAGRDAA